MFSSLFICLLVTLREKNFQTDLHEIFRKDWEYADEQMIKFWWRPDQESGSGTGSGSRQW